MPRIQYQNKNGDRLQGITTLKSQQCGWGMQQLIAWGNKRGREGLTLQQARDTATVPGTIAHSLIECHLKMIDPEPMIDEYSPEDIARAETSYRNFLNWCEQFKFKPIEVEPHLISEKYQLGGTPDVIAEVMGERAIIDWKSGKIYEDVFFQLQFYKLVWEENYPEMPITGGFHVLRIPRDEDIPSFHHSHWARLPDETIEGIEALLTLRRVQPVLKKLL